MKIKSLHIKNFKSLVDLEIVEPNPFTVFVGANGVGKSNIFEALELAYLIGNVSEIEIKELLGGEEHYLPFDAESREVWLKFELERGAYEYVFPEEGNENLRFVSGAKGALDDFTKVIVLGFSRIFIDKEKYQKINKNSRDRLSLSCSNIEKVLKRLLSDPDKREEITEYLQLLIPGFDNVEIQSSELSGTDTLLIYEKGVKRPFTKNLISDGTYNILCLLTAIYQSDEPQFLCIEEPENGLTPYAIEVLVDLIRDKCLENGHYIWLNTHSQTLVRHLKEEELILVDKVEGATKIKQFRKGDFYGLQADEAWLTNALGAGLPW